MEQKQFNKNNSISNTRKSKLTQDQKQILINYYNETFVSKYPKGQFCIFYLRGVCWKKREDCQFAHGSNDLDIQMLQSISQDRKNKKFDSSQNVLNIQQHNFLDDSNRSYQNLFDWQHEHKDLFTKLYSLKELNEHHSTIISKKRVEIRRVMHEFIYNEYIQRIFKEIGSMTIEEFDHLYDCLGFSYNNRKFFQRSLVFQKTETDRITKKKRSFINILPEVQIMLEDFVNVVIEKMNEDLKNRVVVFPLTFKYVNNIVNDTLFCVRIC